MHHLRLHELGDENFAWEFQAKRTVTGIHHGFSQLRGVDAATTEKGARGEY